MAADTKIEWCDHTFNPWIGCTKVSIAATGGGGCDHCYAEISTPARVLRGAGAETWGAGAPRRRTSLANWAMPHRWDAQHEAFFAQHGRRQRVFCASLADVFDNEVDPQWRVDLFNLILSTPNLDWLLLTKRIGNAARMIDETLPASLKALPTDCPLVWPWPHVWIGATIVNQAEADRDIPKLMAVPASVRFLSMEPLLGPVSFRWASWVDRPRMHRENGCEHHLDGMRGIDWVIVGGESGPGARPMHPDWARSLRDQCQAAGVPFLFKQWGEWLPGENAEHPHVTDIGGRPRRVAHHQDGRWGSTSTKVTDANYVTWEADGTMHRGKVDYQWRPVAWAERVGKKAAGRLLDGRTWDEVPT